MRAYTVRLLRERLEEFPDDAKVIVSSDEEGNSFSPLSAVDMGVYTPTTTWSGEYRESEIGEDNNCVCLWPVN